MTWRMVARARLWIYVSKEGALALEGLSWAGNSNRRWCARARRAGFGVRAGALERRWKNFPFPRSWERSGKAADSIATDIPDDAAGPTLSHFLVYAVIVVAATLFLGAVSGQYGAVGIISALGAPVLNIFLFTRVVPRGWSGDFKFFAFVVFVILPGIYLFASLFMDFAWWPSSRH